MTEEIIEDAKDGLAHVKAVIAGVDAEAAKVKAWYKAFPFYAGCAAGALSVLAIRAVVVHLL